MGRQPQQPELRRSELGETVQDATKVRSGGGKADNREFDRDKHPVPPANRPGWQQGQDEPAKRHGDDLTE